MRHNPSSLRYTTFTVKQPMPLLEFLEQALDGISRTRAKAILAGNGVRVDHKNTRQFDLPLQPGQCVEVSKQKPRGELKSKFVKIVYEDSQIIVIEKEVGILSMASAHHQFCVKQVLDDYFHRTRQRCTAHVVHRLDRDTSGLLVYAKTIEAEQILEHNWHDIVTDRRYLAIVSGQLEEPRGTVQSWLKDNKAYFTYSSPTDNGGKFAVTHYRMLRTDGRHSLVELKLETGRKNQIRVHMQDLGHPVCGDVKYGNGDNPIGRLALHAYRLHFYHPITRELLCFETPVPRKFRILDRER
ncbi:MAG: RluA family pseudouridine synthase [Bacteroidales bacterium]|nr:RluA family pseudouridine synthase [Bacteroidales bacterium]